MILCTVVAMFSGISDTFASDSANSDEAVERSVVLTDHSEYS